MATRKTQYAPNNDDDADFLKSIRSNSGAPAEEIQKPVRRVENKDASNQERKLVNVLVPKNTLQEWKQFCAVHDVTLTFTIKKAMATLIKQVEDGTTEL